jgi:hypothetical protein
MHFTTRVAWFDYLKVINLTLQMKKNTWAQFDPSLPTTTVCVDSRKSYFDHTNHWTRYNYIPCSCCFLKTVKVVRSLKTTTFREDDQYPMSVRMWIVYLSTDWPGPVACVVQILFSCACNWSFRVFVLHRTPSKSENTFTLRRKQIMMIQCMYYLLFVTFTCTLAGKWFGGTVMRRRCPFRPATLI